MAGEGAGAAKIGAEAEAARTAGGLETGNWSAEQTCKVAAAAAGVGVDATKPTVQTVAGRVGAGLAGQIATLGVDAGWPTAVVAGGLVAGSITGVGEGSGIEVAAGTAELYLLLRAANYLLCSLKR